MAHPLAPFSEHPFTISDAQALDTIAELLSHEEWDADLFDTVADFVRWTGRTVEDSEP